MTKTKSRLNLQRLLTSHADDNVKNQLISQLLLVLEATMHNLSMPYSLFSSVKGDQTSNEDLVMNTEVL